MMKRFLFTFLTLLLCVTLITTFALAQDGDIYVDANEGNDKTGDGSQDGPYKTITKAIGVANVSSTHNTIHIKKGVYNLVSGEDFPLTIEGANLVGNTDDLGAVKVAGKITFRNSKVQGIHFYRQVKIWEGTTIEKNAFSKIGVALRVLGSCKINNNYFSNNKEVIEVPTTGAGPIEITHNHFSNNNVTLGRTFHCADRLLIDSNEVSGEGARTGFEIAFASGNCQATIRNNTIYTNRVGITLKFNESGGKAVIEGNTISADKNVVIGGSSSAIIDLGGGVLGCSGNNKFQSSKYFIKYELPPYNGKIYAKNNTWKDAYGNTFQPPSTLEGPADTDHFLIKDEGNKIVFSG